MWKIDLKYDYKQEELICESKKGKAKIIMGKNFEIILKNNGEMRSFEQANFWHEVLKFWYQWTKTLVLIY